MRDGVVAGQALTLRGHRRRELQLLLLAAQEDESALRAGQLERGLDQRDEDLIQRAGGVQFARRFQKQRQLLQVRGFLLHPDAGDLAQELARDDALIQQRIEDELRAHSHTELDAVIARELLLLHALLVHEGTQLRAGVHNKIVAVFQDDLRMVAADARVRYLQVLARLAPNGEGHAGQHDLPLLRPVHEYKDREHSALGGAGRHGGAGGGIGHGTLLGLSGGYNRILRYRFFAQGKTLNKSRHTLLRVLGCLALLLAASAAVAEKVKDLRPTNYVNDFAGVLDPGTQENLNALCKEVQDKTGAQIALVTIKSLEGETKERFGNDLFKQWGIGAKKDERGILVLLAIQDRQYWTEVGYGLEPILPDGKVGGFGRDMVPLLKAS